MLQGKWVVLGCQWGDEGKGKVVDCITDNAQIVVRYQGGHNAGHTLVDGDKKTILHLIPSGILHDGAMCLIGPGVVVSLEALFTEIEELQASGVSVTKKLKISPTCPLVLPTHKLLDLAREQARGKDAIGTTGRGIGPAYEDKVARRNLRIGDIWQDDFKKNLVNLLEYHNKILHSFYDHEGVDIEQVYQEYIGYKDTLIQMVADTGEILSANTEDNIIFEGAQGALLDIDHGTYPFVTSSNTIASAAASGSGVGMNFFDGVLGVMKAYCTRVGQGPMPTELHCKSGRHLSDVGHEFGSTTGRPRRCGWLDLVALKYAIRLNGISKLCLTKLDVLSGLEEIKLCTSYKLDGKVLNSFPWSWRELDSVEPVYKSVPGFKENIQNVSNFSDLPTQAQVFIKLIESEISVPIALVSIGQDREAMLSI
ncbi:MAG: adenylosuccinate synthase [Francisellaceae bacterium]|jgi:adenylosuccinate synthase|nr:adenylosuccinate synthase [Francisellaceae bacterium]MBT6538315.1 adenylosuccinate synthase [Francisellaceae bacterium]